jgi:hypothetical protein
VDHRLTHGEEHYVLELVKAVRNNLFHGGKYPEEHIEELERNAVLLRAALRILDGCYQLRPDLLRWRIEALGTRSSSAKESWAARLAKKAVPREFQHVVRTRDFEQPVNGRRRADDNEATTLLHGPLVGLQENVEA